MAPIAPTAPNRPKAFAPSPLFSMMNGTPISMAESPTCQIMNMKMPANSQGCVLTNSHASTTSSRRSPTSSRTTSTSEMVQRTAPLKRKVMTSMNRQVSIPQVPTVKPPISGPSIHAAVIATPLIALACGSSSSSTRSGTNAPIAGIEKAPAPPVRKVTTSSVLISSSPAISATIAKATSTA